VEPARVINNKVRVEEKKEKGSKEPRKIVTLTEKRQSPLYEKNEAEKTDKKGSETCHAPWPEKATR